MPDWAQVPYILPHGTLNILYVELSLVSASDPVMFWVERLLDLHINVEFSQLLEIETDSVSSRYFQWQNRGFEITEIKYEVTLHSCFSVLFSSDKNDK